MKLIYTVVFSATILFSAKSQHLVGLEWSPSYIYDHLSLTSFNVKYLIPVRRSYISIKPFGLTIFSSDQGVYRWKQTFIGALDVNYLLRLFGGLYAHAGIGLDAVFVESKYSDWARIDRPINYGLSFITKSGFIGSKFKFDFGFKGYPELDAGITYFSVGILFPRK